MPEGLPHNPYFLSDLQPVARAAAALPAAGAWDAAPTEIVTAGMDHARLVCTYDEDAAGAGGAFEIAISTSGESSGTGWERATLYAGGGVVGSADTTSTFQREGLQYGAVGATAEAVNFGPLALNGVVERMRIAARETGDAAHPGTLEIKVFLA
jgi:hypothetical protein